MLPTLIFLSWVCAAASDAVSDAKIIDCTHLSSPSSRAAHCRKHVEVDAAAPTIVCVKNDPLTPRMVLGGGLNTYGTSLSFQEPTVVVGSSAYGSEKNRGVGQCGPRGQTL